MTERRGWRRLFGKNKGRKADRHQVAALPWRMGERGLEVLLITSRGTGQWIVPKGGMVEGMTPPQSAAQEAWEEAGVRGSIEQEEAGRFSHLKTRLVGAPLHCRVSVYRMRVEEETESYPEKGMRGRTWFRAEEAAAAVRSRELAALIKALPRNLPGD